MPGTRKLGRTTDHRKAMLRGMVTYLFENGKVETTVTRAKEVRAMAEKMITIAKDNSLHARRQVLAYVTKEDVVKNLFDVIAPDTQMLTADIQESPRPVHAAATQPICALSSFIQTKAELEAKAAAAKKAAKKPAAKKPAAKKSAPKAEKKEAETDATAEAKE